MSQCKPEEMNFQHSASGVISSMVLSFCRLAISASFLVVSDHFWISKICCSSKSQRDLKIQLRKIKIQSYKNDTACPETSGQAIFEKPLCTGDLSPACKIFIERPDP